jgi:hypothetical protein
LSANNANNANGPRKLDPFVCVRVVRGQNKTACGALAAAGRPRTQSQLFALFALFADKFLTDS